MKGELEKRGCSVEINIIKTQGDAIQHLSFDKLEGKGFFTKEIEDALLSKTVDLAVHSHKDLETNPPAGLKIACVSARANPADLLLIRKKCVDTKQKWNLKEDAIVGTSSARRKTQFLHYRNDVTINDLRGNVPTRIDKLRNGKYDAIILAKAGVDRLELDLSEFECVEMDPKEFVPAPAQGVLGLQIRVDDLEMEEIMASMNDTAVEKCISLERRILNLLDGGCQLPLGAYCTEDHHLYVAFAERTGGKSVFYDYEVTEFKGMARKVVTQLKNAFVE